MTRMHWLFMSVILISLLPTPSTAQDWDGLLVGQVGALTRFDRDMRLKIQVGMTPDEVKGVLGRPQAVEGGFPNSKKTIISDLPEQAGQMNNSTWFYSYPQLTLKVDVPQETVYFVNDLKVSKDIFDSCVGVDKVYLYKGEVVSPAAAKSYYRARYTVNGVEVPEDIFDAYVGADTVYIHKGEVVHAEAAKSYEFLKDANLRIVQKNAKQTSFERLHRDVNLKVVQKDTKRTLARTAPPKSVKKEFTPVVAVIFDKGTQVVAATQVFFKIGW